jgi:hypothetical protein
MSFVDISRKGAIKKYMRENPKTSRRIRQKYSKRNFKQKLAKKQSKLQLQVFLQKNDINLLAVFNFCYTV